MIPHAFPAKPGEIESLSDDELLVMMSRDLDVLTRVTLSPGSVAFKALMSEIHTARRVLNARPL